MPTIVIKTADAEQSRRIREMAEGMGAEVQNAPALPNSRLHAGAHVPPRSKGSVSFLSMAGAKPVGNDIQVAD